MKKFFTLFLIILAAGSLNLSLAQTCVPDSTGYTTPPDSGALVPTPLPNAQVGVYYEQAISLAVPDSASGYPLNWLQYSSLTNYLTGNTWTIVDSSGGSTFPRWHKLSWHCATIKGTPTVAGTDSINLYVNANVTILSFPYTVNNTKAYTIPLVVDPVVGVNNYFTNEESLQIFPNPYSESMQVNIYIAKNDNAVLNIFNPLGQRIYSESKLVQPGKNCFSFDGSSLCKGAYMISIVTSGKTYHKNIIKTE